MSVSNGNAEPPPELGPGVKKVVVIGETYCGKTSFIRSYHSRHEPGEVYSNNGTRVYPCEFQLNNVHGRAAIFEIPSDPQFALTQKQPHYDGAHAFVFVFAIDDPSSLDMLTDRWLDELGDSINGVPAIVVGTKRDLRTDEETIDRLKLSGESPVSKEQGEVLLAYDNFLDYFECSTSDADEVDNVFQTIFHFAENGLYASFV